MTWSVCWGYCYSPQDTGNREDSKTTASAAEHELYPRNSWKFVKSYTGIKKNAFPLNRTTWETEWVMACFLYKGELKVVASLFKWMSKPVLVIAPVILTSSSAGLQAQAWTPALFPPSRLRFPATRILWRLTRAFHRPRRRGPQLWAKLCSVHTSSHEKSQGQRLSSEAEMLICSSYPSPCTWRRHEIIITTTIIINMNTKVFHRQWH